MANFLKSLRFRSYVGLTSYCFCNFADELALISFVLLSIDVFLFFLGIEIVFVTLDLVECDFFLFMACSMFHRS